MKNTKTDPIVLVAETAPENLVSGPTYKWVTSLDKDLPLSSWEDCTGSGSDTLSYTLSESERPKPGTSRYFICLGDGEDVSGPIPQETSRKVKVTNTTDNAIIINDRRLVVGFGDSYVDYSDSRDEPQSGDPYNSLQRLKGVTAAMGASLSYGLQTTEMGHGGDSFWQMLPRVDSVKALKPEVVVLVGGTNDIGFHGSYPPEDDRTFDATKSAEYVDQILKAFAPIPVVVLEQIYFDAHQQRQVDELNAAVDLVIAANDNAYRAPLNHFTPNDGVTFISKADPVHPTGEGSLLIGKDLSDAVNAIVKSTWKPDANLIPKDLNGTATNSIPEGWTASGDAVHSQEGGYQKMVVTGASKRGSLTSQVYTNNTGKTVIMQASALVKSANFGDTEYPGWQEIDPVSDVGYLQITGITGHSSFNTYANDVNGGNTSEVRFRTGQISVPNGSDVTVSFNLSGGSHGSGAPELMFKDVELYIVPEITPGSIVPETPTVELTVDGKDSVTVAKGGTFDFDLKVSSELVGKYVVFYKEDGTPYMDAGAPQAAPSETFKINVKSVSYFGKVYASVVTTDKETISSGMVTIVEEQGSFHIVTNPTPELRSHNSNNQLKAWANDWNIAAGDTMSWMENTKGDLDPPGNGWVESVSGGNIIDAHEPSTMVWVDGVADLGWAYRAKFTQKSSGKEIWSDAAVVV